MLGRTGRCKSFDNSANGYARGEAVIACVFKKGQGAEDVENRVGSFVSGFVNQDGRSASLTVSWPWCCRAFGSVAIESHCFLSDLHLENRDVSEPCLITRELWFSYSHYDSQFAPPGSETPLWNVLWMEESVHGLTCSDPFDPFCTVSTMFSMICHICVCPWIPMISLHAAYIEHHLILCFVIHILLCMHTHTHTYIYIYTHNNYFCVCSSALI